MTNEVKLTDKQKELLERIPQVLRRETALAYIANGYENQTKAYLDACKAMGRNPSRKPETSASEILNYPNVIDFINSVKVMAAEAVQIDASYVLRRLYEIDNLDILDIVKDDLSSFKPLNEWPRAWRISIHAMDMKRIITSIDDKESMETIIEKIKWPDKTKNLELIGRHTSVKAWDKEKETTSADSIADSLAKLVDKFPS